MTRFVHGSVTLQFNCDPTRPANKRRDGRQVRETDSTGTPVVYSKGPPITVYRLSFPRLTTAVLDSLLSFVATEIEGQRHAFTWIDHAEVSRTARLTTSSLRYAPRGPGRYQAEIELEVAA